MVLVSQCPLGSGGAVGAGLGAGDGVEQQVDEGGEAQSAWAPGRTAHSALPALTSTQSPSRACAYAQRWEG